VLLAAVVPPGRHVITLHYWPRLLTVGLVVCAATGAILLLALAWPARPRRRANRAGRGLHAARSPFVNTEQD